MFLAHTVLARANMVYDLYQMEIIPGVTSLCQLADQDVSLAYNLLYTPINRENCSQLSTSRQFYYVDNTAIADKAGLGVERRSTLVDLQDAITWLLVMFSIEIAIWLQERDITGGPMMVVSRAGKIFYGVLLLNTVYWAYMGHWLYTWDQILWIGGFFAIELNVRDWRKDISKHREQFEKHQNLAATESEQD